MSMGSQVNGQNKQAGFVSLFTVIFFMLLVTVITIGFLRIMGVEQQQALDNDLTDSAIAAAESGIEDGKRAILAYHTTTDASLRSALAAAFNSTQCDALTSSPTIRTALGFTQGGNVIGNSQLNQYYTCLTVNLDSPNYINQGAAGASDFIPLVSADPGGFDQVKISWHLISQSINAEGDGIPADYANDSYLYPLTNSVTPANSWTARGYPAYLRVQLYGYPNNMPITRANIDQRTNTLLLVPTRASNASAIDENTPINFATADPRGFEQPKNNLQTIECKDNPSSQVGSYACTALLELSTTAGLRGPTNNYFLRVTPVYGQSHFSVQMRLGGNPVNFRGVQPIVDATGRAADVFRRLQARVRINPAGNLPEFVVDSANTICKNMVVSDGSYYLANNCP